MTERTEALAVEYDIPDDRLGEARELAHVPTEDETAAGSYPIDGNAARTLGWGLGRDISPDLYNWFVKPFAD